MDKDFYVETDLEEIRLARAKDKRQPLRLSKLFRWHDELQALRVAGASYREIRRWLLTKRVRCEATTVMRYLNREKRIVNDNIELPLDSEL